MIGAVREYFLLSDAGATAKLLPETVRSTLHRRLSLARQRAEGADALWSNGHVAEGLRLAAEAFEATLEAIEPFESAAKPAESAAKPADPAPEPAPVPAPDLKAESEAKAESESKAESEAESEAEAEAKSESESESESEAEAKSEAEAETEAKSETDAETEAQPETDAAPAIRDAVPTVEESQRAAAEAIDAAQDARPHDPAWAAALRKRGLSDAKVRDVIATERALRAHQLPLLDTEVSAAEGELFQQLVGARRHVDRVLGPVSMTPRQLMWTRVSRIGFAAFLALVAIVGVYLLLRPVSGVEARASAQFNAEFAPDKVIDDDPETEWLLPPEQPGWVEVAILPPQRIDQLRLRNSHNRQFNDRATKDYTVEIYANGRLARSIQGSWPQLSPRPDWTTHAVGIDDVERVRVNVRTFHRNGGGLAEIDWE